MALNLKEFRDSVKANDSYNFPNMIDILPCILYFFLILGIYQLLVYFLYDRMQYFLAEKYITGDDKQLNELYRIKLIVYLYKFLYFTIISIIGWFVLKDLYFFPANLGGNGRFRDLVTQPTEKVYFWEKPKYFDHYYNINFGYALFDSYLLLSLPKQTDFDMLALHHLSTIGLVLFTFLSNYSNFGCVVFYLHYLSDAFSYVCRFSIQSNFSELIKFIATSVFLIVFSFYRLFVFGNVIYDTWFFWKKNEVWLVIDHFLTYFMIFLYILHISWIVLISRKFLQYLIFGNLEDIYTVKKKK